MIMMQVLALVVVQCNCATRLCSQVEASSFNQCCAHRAQSGMEDVIACNHLRKM